MSRLYLAIAIGAAALAMLGVVAAWQRTLSVENALSFASVVAPPRQDLAVRLKKRKEALNPKSAKGIYLTAYSADDAKKVDEMIALLDQTELNTVVIDIKDYSGTVLYESQVPLARELGLFEAAISDVPALIEKFHGHGIYVIARQTVFQDPLLAGKKPEWAIQSKAGGVWRDHKGLSWVDPTRREVWEYNVQIAREAIMLGFDEINFDYVRFPTDGNMSQVVYTNGEEELYDVMGKFYEYLHDELGSESAQLSLDFFGFVMERHDGMTIGQRLVDAVDRVDYVSPMMYPSHYPAGHLGLANPAAHPALVIENGMKKGMPYVASSTTRIRPWIQAFNIGAVYGAESIRAQIDAVEKYSDAGWLLWNAVNRYSDAGLKPN